jgi:hypothetical protein
MEVKHMSAQEIERRPPSESDEATKKPRLLRVKVVENGRPTVNVKVPIGVAKVGMKLARAFSPEVRDAEVDWDEVMSVIETIEDGKLVEVEDEAQHKTVEVWVE